MSLAQYQTTLHHDCHQQQQSYSISETHQKYSHKISIVYQMFL